ncbi:6-bladed beta-propeller [Bacteroides fragilis]|uniref:6-bladed beta-propeller n=1 Tax=Bacteroides fragilis TaxID=817 RepID=UPI001F2C77DF|nr:6-bladed beta-propeller [Bacteroides fragilis]UHZ84140.1 6-bladed beta-propeller [Bacteroides fragilis]
MKNILVFIIIAMGLAACRRSSTITPRDVKGIKTVNIDKNNVVSIYDIFSKVEIIPLEMTEESALGYPLRKILVNDGNYYVLDYTQNTIFKFDSCGKYLDKINKLGSAPEEYTLLYDFSFNPYNQNLELMSAMGYINGEFYQFNLSSCIRQQNSLTAQFVSFNLSNLANIFYPPQFLQ